MKQYEIKVASEDRSLAATLFVPDIVTGSALLFGHGYGRDRHDFEPYAYTATMSGAVCLAYDLSGHGASPSLDAGAMTIADHVTDMTAAFDSVANRWGVSDDRVGIFGQSFSGNLALQVARLRPVKHLLLQAPAAYDDQIALAQRRLYNRENSRAFRERSPLPDCQTLRAAKEYSGELTVAESEHDEIMPSNVMRSIVAVAAHGLHHVVPGAKHALSGKPSMFFSDEILAPWVQKL